MSIIDELAGTQGHTQAQHAPAEGDRAQQNPLNLLEEMSKQFEGEPGQDGDDDYSEFVLEAEAEAQAQEDYQYRRLYAEQQWQESLQQITQLLNFVILPLVGKVIGRKVAGYSECLRECVCALLTVAVWRAVMERRY